VLSLALPLLSLPTETVETLPVPVGVIALPTTVIATTPIETGPDWTRIGEGCYGAIVVLLIARLLLRITGLLRLIYQSPRQQANGYILVEPTNDTTPTFSFFQYLVINPADRNNEQIIQHELVHIREHHSADVLAIELLRTIFWLCPALWLIERSLRQVHEFLADRAANQPTDYARFLVEYAFGLQPIEVVHSPIVNGFFNPSMLKQRIQMLQQKATTRWALGKYMLVLPLAFGLLAMTTAREEITAAFTQQSDTGKTVSGQVSSSVDSKPLSGAIVAVKNRKRKTTTNAEGRFTLSGIDEKDVLVFSFPGFDTQEIPIGKSTAISVSLAQKGLDKVVVVAAEPTKIAKPSSANGTNGEVFLVVDEAPEFPGGVQALGQYLAKNLRYPKEAQQNHVQGRVFVQFVVTTQGTIEQLRVLKGIGSGCDEEAVRVVSQMPHWKPGRKGGQNVAVQYNIPIQFELEKSAYSTPTIQPDSTKKQGFNMILDNTKNAKYGLFEDTKIRSYPAIDSSWKGKTKITIRGKGPLGPLGESPLYILDGTEVSEKLFNSLGDKDIQSIDVLKGSSATSVYGEKGKNGVVIITTKKS
jgi:TonB family protein